MGLAYAGSVRAGLLRDSRRARTAGARRTRSTRSLLSPPSGAQHGSRHARRRAGHRQCRRRCGRRRPGEPSQHRRQPERGRHGSPRRWGTRRIAWILRRHLPASQERRGDDQCLHQLSRSPVLQPGGGLRHRGRHSGRHPHQRARGIGCQPDPRDLQRRPHDDRPGEGCRPKRGPRRGQSLGLGGPTSPAAPGQLRQPAGRRHRARHRFAVRPAGLIHGRHRLGLESRHDRSQRTGAHRHDPDRRADQSRELRRRTARRSWPADRRQ